jgi:CHAT domain-containing protein
VIGDPRHDDDGSIYSPLPAARAEATDIASQYQGATLLLGERATKQAFLAHLSQANVVHFAGHAVVNARLPWLSRLLLAPSADSAGILYIGELKEIHLSPGCIVVLAACESGAGSFFRGEGLASLAVPFVSAGAGSVIATLWRIDDDSSRTIFSELHRRLQSANSAVAALSRVQRDLIAGDDPRMREPASWASLEAIGGVLENRK